MARGSGQVRPAGRQGAHAMGYLVGVREGRRRVEKGGV